MLKRLMFEKNIKAMELARQTNLPQPTIQRIVSGTTPNPHTSSLLPIARFFNVSVDQLKGLEPIPWLQKETQPQGLIQIPLLTWEEVKSRKDIKTRDSLVWVESKISPKSYALTIQDTAMQPLFPKGALIIIDPEKEPKDRSYVVVALKNYDEVIFRQLLTDADRYYLKALSPDLENFPMLPLKSGDKICGVMVQARKNYYDE